MNPIQQQKRNIQSYILSEFDSDINEAMKNGNYERARLFAERKHGYLFKIYTRETGWHKQMRLVNLKRLSQLIDELNDKINFGERKK